MSDRRERIDADQEAMYGHPGETVEPRTGAFSNQAQDPNRRDKMHIPQVAYDAALKVFLDLSHHPTAERIQNVLKYDGTPVTPAEVVDAVVAGEEVAP